MNLLPGQLRDVQTAIEEVRNTPPPLPSVNRPLTIPRPSTVPDLPPEFQSQPSRDSFSAEVPRNDARAHSSGDLSSQFGVSGQHNANGFQVGTVDNLRQLRDRQHDLMFKSLDSGGSAPTSPPSHPVTPSTGFPSAHSFNRSGSREDAHLQQHVFPGGGGGGRFNPAQAWEVESLHGRDDRSNGESGFEEDFAPNLSVCRFLSS